MLTLLLWRNKSSRNLLDLQVILKARKQDLRTLASSKFANIRQSDSTQTANCIPSLKVKTCLLQSTNRHSVPHSRCFGLTSSQFVPNLGEKNPDLPDQDCSIREETTHYSSAQPYYYTFPLIVGVQEILVNTQSFTGLPWWATIMSTTILLRFLITLPLARTQAITLAKIELLQPAMKEVIEALRHNITIKGKRNGQTDEEVQRSFRQEARKYTYDIYKRDNCNPLKLYFLPWVQLPLWILISLALRNISGYFPKATESSELIQHNPDLVTGGCLWFQDLTISDPYFILPVIIGVTNLLNIELNTLKRRVPSKKQQIITRVFRFLTVGMVFVASQVPSAMSIYWATSSSYGLAQNVFLLQPKIRRKLGIPQAPSESKTPFKEKLELLKTRLQMFMAIQRK